MMSKNRKISEIWSPIFRSKSSQKNRISISWEVEERITIHNDGNNFMSFTNKQIFVKTLCLINGKDVEFIVKFLKMTYFARRAKNLCGIKYVWRKYARSLIWALQIPILTNGNAPIACEIDLLIIFHLSKFSKCTYIFIYFIRKGVFGMSSCRTFNKYHFMWKILEIVLITQMFTQKYSLTVKTRLQIKFSTITDEKLFRMSSCSHKWHNYDQNFLLLFFLISLCITKRQYSVVNHVENF